MSSTPRHGIQGNGIQGNVIQGNVMADNAVRIASGGVAHRAEARHSIFIFHFSVFAIMIRSVIEK